MKAKNKSKLRCRGMHRSGKTIRRDKEVVTIKVRMAVTNGGEGGLVIGRGMQGAPP